MSTTQLAQQRPHPILKHAPEFLQSSQMMAEGVWAVLYLLACAGAADVALLAFKLIGVIGYELEAYCGLVLALVFTLYFGVATALAVERSLQMRKGHA